MVWISAGQTSSVVGGSSVLVTGTLRLAGQKLSSRYDLRNPYALCILCKSEQQEVMAADPCRADQFVVP